MERGGVTTEMYQTITAIVEDKLRDIRVTRESFDRLTEAQARSEERLGRVEQALEKLVHIQSHLAKEVGALSTTIGFGLEDVAKVVLPGYLERHCNISLKKELERRFFSLDGRELEVNLYGEGKRNGKKVTIIGEAKSRIYDREVRRFVRQISPLLPHISGDVIKVMFGFLIHPSAEKPAQEAEIILIASYQR